MAITADQQKPGEHDQASGKATGEAPAPKIVVQQGAALFAGEVHPLVASTLRDRLFPDGKSGRLEATLAAIHKRLAASKSTAGAGQTPATETGEWTALGLSAAGVRDMSPEDFSRTLLTAADKTPWTIWALLATEGYDLWLTKGGLSVEEEPPACFGVGLLEQLAKMCEVGVCKETKAIVRAAPTYLRFTSVQAERLAIHVQHRGQNG